METNKNSNSPKPALGKGLASLFPSLSQETMNPAPTGESIHLDAATLQEVEDATKAALTSTVPNPNAAPVSPENRDRHPGISLANPEEIETNPFQPRRDFDDQALEDLVQSIQANGIISPLVVRKTPAGRFQLIAGERRLRAAIKLGLKQVPIVIRRSTDRESLEIAIIENIQRQDLNCIETAVAYFQLIDEFNLTQEEVARRVGKDRASVANHLRLLKLPEPIMEDLKKGILTFGHGKILLSLPGSELQLTARAQILERRLSVRDSEMLIDSLNQEHSRTTENAEGENPLTENAVNNEAQTMKKRLRHLSDSISRVFSVKSLIQGDGERGKLILHYQSREDLDRILNIMKIG